MTQEEKDLLLKDLCSRLPYGVKLQHVKNTDSIVELYSIDLDYFYCKIQFYTYKGKALTASEEGKLLKPGEMLRYKPCLFPLSSMTEEQKNDCPINETTLNIINSNIGCYGIIEIPWRLSFLFIDWCNKNHFDYRGLIPMGLAIDATNLNIY